MGDALMQHKPSLYLATSLPADFASKDCDAGRIRCAAVEKLSPSEQQRVLLYDDELIQTLMNGTPGEVRAKVGYPEANAQNRFGETILMKMLRHVIWNNNRRWLFSLLLGRGADPMVCCDSGKNLLHDLFWAAKANPVGSTNEIDEEQALHLHRFTTMVIEMIWQRIGSQELLCLLGAKDQHGNNPVDYINPEMQPHWMELLDFIVTRIRSQTTASSRATWVPRSQNKSVGNEEICGEHRRERSNKRRAPEEEEAQYQPDKAVFSMMMRLSKSAKLDTTVPAAVVVPH